MKLSPEVWIDLLSRKYGRSAESVVTTGRLRQNFRITQDVWKGYFADFGGLGVQEGAEIELVPEGDGGGRLTIPNGAWTRLSEAPGSALCVTRRDGRFFLKKLALQAMPSKMPGWVLIDAYDDLVVTRHYANQPSIDEIDPEDIHQWLAAMRRFKADPVQALAETDGVLALLTRKLMGPLSDDDLELQAALVRELCEAQNEDGSWGGGVTRTAGAIIRLLELGVSFDAPSVAAATAWMLALPEPEGLPGLFMFSVPLTERFSAWKAKPGAKGRPHRRESKGELRAFLNNVDYTIRYASDPCELRLTWTSALVLEALLRCRLADHPRVVLALNTLVALSGHGGWCGCGYLDAKWRVAASDAPIDFNAIDVPAENSPHHVDWFPTERDLLNPSVDGHFEPWALDGRQAVLVKQWHNTGLCSMVMHRALSHHPDYPGSRLEAYGVLRLAYIQSSIGTWGRQVFPSSMVGFCGRYTHPLAAYLALRSVPMLIRTQGEDGFWLEDPLQGDNATCPVPTREQSTFMIVRALQSLGFLDALRPESR